MSGHSKWSTIKHKKAANDAKKGKIFSKLSSQITQAAREGGGDPFMNPTLRLYLDKAKSASFPIDRIEKAIAKGTGKGSNGIVYEEISYEGFGPKDVALIVDCITDNKNRIVSELRQLFEEVGGHIGESGSVAWNFETKGLVVIKCGHMQKAEKFGQEDIFVKEDVEEVMMKVMDIPGVMDIKETEVEGVKALEIYSKYEDVIKVRNVILKLNYVLEEANIIKVPKMVKELSEEDMEKVYSAIERIEENDDVENVWSDVG